VPSGYLGTDEKAPLYPYDPAKAKALLAEAGYPNGLTIKTIHTTLTGMQTLIEAVQAQLKKVGINLDIELVEHATFHAQIRKDLSPIVHYQAARFPVADVYLTQFFDSKSIVGSPTAVTNFSHCNVADDDIRAARSRRIPSSKGVVEGRRRRRSSRRSVPFPIYEQLQLWAWKDTLDLGYDLQGSLNLSPPITEKTHFTSERAIGNVIDRGRLGHRFHVPRRTHDRVRRPSTGVCLRDAVRGLTLVFVLVRIVPGDPAQLILGDQASREAIETLRHRLGLDLPIGEQYLVFLSGALRGDWGVSMVTGQPVISEVLRVLPWTIELTVVSLVLGIVIGVPGGVYAAVHRNRLTDYAVRIASLLGLSFPPFVAAIILLLAFAIALPWFPVISARSGVWRPGTNRSRCRPSVSGSSPLRTSHASRARQCSRSSPKTTCARRARRACRGRPWSGVMHCATR
jgi:hypothetical protein